MHARSLRPDVIVAGTHQRRGIDRFAVGSVAERIAAKATVPVLLIPWRRHAGTIRPFSHVAVAVDFSTGSNRAVEQALALASDSGDRVTLLHVVPGFSVWCAAALVPLRNRRVPGPVDAGCAAAPATRCSREAANTGRHPCARPSGRYHDRDQSRCRQHRCGSAGRRCSETRRRFTRIVRDDCGAFAQSDAASPCWRFLTSER